MQKGYALCLNEWIEDDRIGNDLALLLKISSLTAKEGFCFASNSYFSKMFKKTEVSISRKIKRLEVLGYIEITYEKRGCEITKRKIRLSKMITDDYQKRQSTIIKNDKDNSISNNSINNNSIINNTVSPKSRKDIDFLLKGIEAIVGIIDEPLYKQRRYAKNFIDSKIPNLYEKKHKRKPTAQEIQNSTCLLFSIAKNSGDAWIRGNSTSIAFVYNNIGKILTNKRKIAKI
ncbi:MAG: helix-turn-helix domain-containing protein [Actinobacteria bacterium]|nr:helix-turn-helix domain-containing protein [Actinomycetota bacterium]